MEPSLAKDGYRVALVGEALGENEAVEGSPFVGKAGFTLSRLIEWAGLERGKFDIWNVCWCRPPDNLLEGMEYEEGAINHCQGAHWGRLVDRVHVVVPMGNVPLGAFTGRKGILSERGYVGPGPGQTHLLPTVHPSFITRGQSKYSAAFIHDLQKAVELARRGLIPEPTDYLLDPLPIEAMGWAHEYADAYKLDPNILLAFDIETPGKDTDESESDEDDPTFFIWRISFAYKPFSALSIPWTPEFIPIIRILLESAGAKVVWNAGFDCPRIRHNGVGINGVIHDGMVAWHILHSDLPKGLGFVATFTCPYQPRWKHLSHSSPAFYNATDSDVELRSFLKIRDELKKSSLWGVYQRDVLDLEPILMHMTKMGMPLDPIIRLDRAERLASKQSEVMASMVAAVPLEARIIDHVFVNPPADPSGLFVRPGVRSVRSCPACGLSKPPKAHFQTFKKKVNPCAGLSPVSGEVKVDEYYRLAEWKPSRVQLIRYQETLGRPVPTAWDKKTRSRKPSMDEKALKGLVKKYPDDKLYPLILEFRTLDKIAGTYIGRPNAI